MGTGGEALDLLLENLRATGHPGVDIILKQHEPPSSNAPRFLRKLRAVEALASLPVIGEDRACGGGLGWGWRREVMAGGRGRYFWRARYRRRRLQRRFQRKGGAEPNAPPFHPSALCAVLSTQDSRGSVVACLSAGASDYWLAPLRKNEVQNLWTRVWRSRAGAPGGVGSDDANNANNISSGDASDTTKK